MTNETLKTAPAGPYLKPLLRADLPEMEPTFQLTEQFLGFLPNDVLTMARMPAATKAFMDFCIAVYSTATLSPQLLHLVGLMASSAAGCVYCTAHTANKSNEDGVDAAKISAIWEFQNSPLFDAGERGALSFALKAAQTPSGLDAEDFRVLAQHYSDVEITEILMVICQFGFWNRWNDSVATTLETTPFDFAEATLPKARWKAGKHRP